MFTKIERRISSIISDEPIEKIAHLPSQNDLKLLSMIFNLDKDKVERVYLYNLSEESYDYMVVIHTDNNKLDIDTKTCFVKGIPVRICFIKASELNKSEENVASFVNIVTKYISNEICFIIESLNSKGEQKYILDVVYQAVPVLICAILRRVYSGPMLNKIIHVAISTIDLYKDKYSEAGIDSIMDLLDEGLTVSELLDNSYICSTKYHTKKYPGIWPEDWDMS